MATKIGYVSRDPSEQINWAEVGANFTGMLKEEARVREEKKAEIDKATREMEKVLENSPTGDSKNMNEWALDYAADAQKELLMVNTLLKSGQLKPQDYTVIRQNLADGTDQAFTLAQEYQTEFSEKTARAAADPGTTVGPDGKTITGSQELETFLMGTVEGFGNFTKSKLMITPRTGKVMVGFINDKGEVESDPNKLVGINNLRNRIKAKFDAYDMDAAIAKAKAGAFGAFSVVSGDLGGLYQKGMIVTAKGAQLRNAAGLAKLVEQGVMTAEEAKLLGDIQATENSWAESQLSNSYNTTSLLTNNLGGIAPNGKMYTFTLEPSEEDENHILIKQIDGNIVPDFESDMGKKHREDAKSGLITRLRGALDIEIKSDPISGNTPPQPSQVSIDNGNNKKITANLASAWNSIAMSDSAEEKQAKLEAILGDERVKSSGLWDINMSTPDANGNFTIDFIYPKNPEQNRLGVPINADMTLEEWSALGAEIHGITDAKEALRIGGGGTGSAKIKTGGFSSGIKAKRGAAPEYKGAMNDYISDKFAPPGTDARNYNTATSDKVNFFLSGQVVAKQLIKNFSEIGLKAVSAGDIVTITIPGSTKAPLPLEVNLYQNSNQQKAAQQLLKYISEATPTNRINTVAKTKNWAMDGGDANGL